MIEVDATQAVKTVLLISLAIYAVFWGSVAYTLFTFFEKKELTRNVLIGGFIAFVSGIVMIVFGLMLLPSFQWIYNFFGFALK